MHAAAAVAACMNRHACPGMHAVVSAAAAAAACMRARVAACVIDTMYISTDLHVGADPGVENRFFVYRHSRLLGTVKGTSSGSYCPNLPF